MICSFCGKVFKQKRKDQRFCSAGCRRKYFSLGREFGLDLLEAISGYLKVAFDEFFARSKLEKKRGRKVLLYGFIDEMERLRAWEKEKKEEING